MLLLGCPVLRSLSIPILLPVLLWHPLGSVAPYLVDWWMVARARSLPKLPMFY